MAYRNGPKIITDGLVLCLDAAISKSYPGSGTVWKDLSGNGNNGTLINGPTFSSDNGGSLVFDGSNEWVACSASLSKLNITTQFTYEVTFYITSNNAYNRYDLIGYNGYSPSNIWGYNLSVVLQRPSFFYRDSSTNAINLYVYSSQISFQTWNTYSVVCDNGYFKFYVNGQLYHNFTTQENLTGFTGQAFNIGGLIYSGNFNLNGNISRVLTYNKNLSSQEIQQNYKATKGRFGL